MCDVAWRPRCIKFVTFQDVTGLFLVKSKYMLLLEHNNCPLGLDGGPSGPTFCFPQWADRCF